MTINSYLVAIWIAMAVIYGAWSVLGLFRAIGHPVPWLDDLLVPARHHRVNGRLVVSLHVGLAALVFADVARLRWFDADSEHWWVATLRSAWLASALWMVWRWWDDSLTNYGVGRPVVVWWRRVVDRLR